MSNQHSQFATQHLKCHSVISTQRTEAKKSPAAPRAQVQDPRLHRLTEAEVQLLPRVTGPPPRPRYFYTKMCVCERCFDVSDDPPDPCSLSSQEYTAKILLRYIRVIRL